ncbi:hypothetical protein ACFC18_13365 [Streptomyces sp. NPDC056121]|uniref:hypothetical protein n=1 Tax=Streptomyces TaxID=1883 RepID=UPI001D09F4EE|nr:MULTISPECIES: hypothetical protein [Streptomyces]MCX5080276.1 hypothetical protein [Streptomyces sp. NBC_00401]UDL98519.1 hypothetical protein LGI35_09745 [Streptomyces longhuiensis]
MRKYFSSLLAAAALTGAVALPVVTAAPASAAATKCAPTSHDYTVAEEKVPVHSSISGNAAVIDYIYKNNSVHAYWACTNSSGNPWVCIGSCKVTEDAITGRWVYRNYLR